ncbi:hypothetical protein DV515_00007010 [Chloebia gouldiae]|uniref:Uncharacterized protein n=1 Tax=Chloebia gouldiae TaxID=44316 RepID=A0A3L8SJJ0_CHLGU|nr:hypothetical protein DV515_00007010 [Chloebia gouldiae]
MGPNTMHMYCSVFASIVGVTVGESASLSPLSRIVTQAIGQERLEPLALQPQGLSQPFPNAS